MAFTVALSQRQGALLEKILSEMPMTPQDEKVLMPVIVRLREHLSMGHKQTAVDTWLDDPQAVEKWRKGQDASHGHLPTRVG